MCCWLKKKVQQVQKVNWWALIGGSHPTLYIFFMGLNPLRPNINTHVLLTVLHIFLMELVGRI